MNVRTGRYWVQPQVLNDKTLKVAIEEDNRDTYDKLAVSYQVPADAIKLHLQRIGKV